ncbi:hypothetical protein BP6252_04784 [Coleophoma cylindrospora]|uniref:Tyrosinase copper-binding domain-containing protein n=1 Tax=Coleophoma cylindrospora TaxID=1849047 RepID=A0A3D8S1L2_9HELO|nr:hypothetical protein BP6252_04784 [Coleophoma cylindrospora]
MRFPWWPATVAISGSFNPATTAQTDALASIGAWNLANFQRSVNSTCTLKNAVVRREWDTFSGPERKAYTDAVLCLMAAPSITDPAIAPGAKTRYDDFVAVHMNQTLTIHGTANFLAWHRYFTYTYEQALINECGYKGAQPYWNWARSALDPIHSPVFDGSEYSMSGNGEYEAHNCTNALPSGLNCIPPGEGGGCVTTGPFRNMTVNLGPVYPTLAEPEVVPASSLLAYNPRCLKRDISVWVSSNYTTDAIIADLITQNLDIVSFQNTMQGDFPAGIYGVHSGGHYTIGGDPGGDLFTSPGDPAFFLHHAQIDRTWWIWQNQDLANRLMAFGGTITLNNSPPSRNGTLNDTIDLGINAGAIPIRDIMNTMAGPLCYIYV